MGAGVTPAPSSLFWNPSPALNRVYPTQAVCQADRANKEGREYPSRPFAKSKTLPGLNIISLRPYREEFSRLVERLFVIRMVCDFGYNLDISHLVFGVYDKNGTGEEPEFLDQYAVGNAERGVPVV